MFLFLQLKRSHFSFYLALSPMALYLSIVQLSKTGRFLQDLPEKFVRKKAARKDRFLVSVCGKRKFSDSDQTLLNAVILSLEPGNFIIFCIDLILDVSIRSGNRIILCFGCICFRRSLIIGIFGFVVGTLRL